MVRRLRVLVAEDDVVSSMVDHKLLGTLGQEVVVVNDRHQAFEAERERCGLWMLTGQGPCAAYSAPRNSIHDLHSAVMFLNDFDTVGLAPRV